MNVLILDDDAYIIRALRNQINWNGIGVTNVYTVLNTQRAKDIMREITIDIIVTDIEMPQENGLDFMRWVLHEGYSPEAICITCHATFEYAKEALSLGYSEYCVKPIEFSEFERLIHEAVERRIQKALKQKAEIQGKMWEINKTAIAIDFWSRLLQGKYADDAHNLSEIALQKGVSYAFDQKYQCVVFVICAMDPVVENGELNACKTTLLERISENFPIQHQMNMIGIIDQYFWIIFCDDYQGDINFEIEDFLEKCHEHMGVQLAAYVSECVFGELLTKEYKKLLQCNFNNINRDTRLFLSEPNGFDDREHKKFMLMEYRALLKNDAFPEYFLRAEKYISQNDGLTRDTLKSFVFHIFMLACSRILELDINPEDFLDEKWIEETLEGCASIEEALSLIRTIRESVMQAIDNQQAENNMIGNIKKFIHENIETKLSRNIIAESVHLSPDYLSKLFHRETGQTLIGYITEKKILAAKNMLTQDRLQVSEVAIRLGYDNLSYFSELFRKVTGVRPSEYKK